MKSLKYWLTVKQTAFATFQLETMGETVLVSMLVFLVGIGHGFILSKEPKKVWGAWLGKSSSRTLYSMACGISCSAGEYYLIPVQ